MVLPIPTWGPHMKTAVLMIASLLACSTLVVAVMFGAAIKLADYGLGLGDQMRVQMMLGAVVGFGCMFLFRLSFKE